MDKAHWELPKRSSSARLDGASAAWWSEEEADAGPARPTAARMAWRRERKLWRSMMVPGIKPNMEAEVEAAASLFG